MIRGPSPHPVPGGPRRTVCPDGRPRSSRGRCAAVVAFAPGELAAGPRATPEPAPAWRASPLGWSRRSATLGRRLLVARLASTCAIVLAPRYRRSRTVERAQVKWVAAAGTLSPSCSRGPDVGPAWAHRHLSVPGGGAGPGRDRDRDPALPALRDRPDHRADDLLGDRHRRSGAVFAAASWGSRPSWPATDGNARSPWRARRCSRRQSSSRFEGASSGGSTGASTGRAYNGERIVDGVRGAAAGRGGPRPRSWTGCARRWRRPCARWVLPLWLRTDRRERPASCAAVTGRYAPGRGGRAPARPSRPPAAGRPRSPA